MQECVYDVLHITVLLTPAVTRVDHRFIFCNPTRPAKFSNQLLMTAKVEFSKYSINILHDVKFMFRDVKSCKHHMHEKYAQ